MRLLILACCTALALAACGKNNQSDNAGNSGDILTADNIVSNDVTAIDAVTGDAANMAADVNYSGEFDNEAGNEVSAPAGNGSKAPRSGHTATATSNSSD